MELICSRCHTHNQSNAHFCQKCGNGFNVQPIGAARQNTLSTPVIIIIAVVAICGFCGIFGSLSGNKTEVTTTNTAPAKSFASTVPTATLSPETTDSKNATNTVGSSEPSANGAVVISENANLRQTPDSNGEVIEMLAENTKTEVIRQKGAWFYVRAAGKTGWLHGNTIRLADRRSSQESAKKTTGESQTTYTTANKKSENEETNLTGSDDDEDAANGSSRYITGPRGGCYYINGNGNKTYVDRSMCGGTTPTRSQSSSSSSSSGGYILGPRGGCYRINRNGNKTYVDRSLCN